MAERNSGLRVVPGAGAVGPPVSQVNARLANQLATEPGGPKLPTMPHMIQPVCAQGFVPVI
jgi:hypothetical protein